MEAEVKNIISELLTLEVMGEQLRKRAYQARMKLERFHAPVSPKGLAKQKAAKEQEVSLIANFRKSQLKKRAV